MFEFQKQHRVNTETLAYLWSCPFVWRIRLIKVQPQAIEKNTLEPYLIKPY